MQVTWLASGWLEADRTEEQSRSVRALEEAIAGQRSSRVTTFRLTFESKGPLTKTRWHPDEHSYLKAARYREVQRGPK